jgi:hypothetical protein
MSDKAKEKMMGGYICQRCPFPVDFLSNSSKAYCEVCGAVSDKPNGDTANGNWLKCLAPEGFEWGMTSGVKGPEIPMKVDGKNRYIDYDALQKLKMNAKVIYIGALGEEMSRGDWIKTRGVDPAVELATMRARMKKQRPVLQLG